MLPSIDLKREANRVRSMCWHRPFAEIGIPFSQRNNRVKCFGTHSDLSIFKKSCKCNYAFNKRGYAVCGHLEEVIDYLLGKEEDFHIENSLKRPISKQARYGNILHIHIFELIGTFSAKDRMDRSTAAGYGGNTQSAQPEFSGPTMYQPNTASPATNYGGENLFAEPESSGPTVYQANTVRGTVWSTGLFDCHEDETNAVMTAFLPCVTFGQIAEVMDQGELTCPLGSLIYALMMPALCSQWLMGSKYRTRLRERYNLVEAPYTDIISHVFCPCCSLCQEFRELRKRGLDPALGWNGILAQRQATEHETVGVPPPRQTMF